MAFERLFAAWVVATEPRDDQGDDDGLPLGDAFEPLSDCALRRDLGVLKRLSFLTPKRRSFFFAVRFLLLQKSEPYSLSLSLSTRRERRAKEERRKSVFFNFVQHTRPWEGGCRACTVPDSVADENEELVLCDHCDAEFHPQCRAARGRVADGIVFQRSIVSSGSELAAMESRFSQNEKATRPARIRVRSIDRPKRRHTPVSKIQRNPEFRRPPAVCTRGRAISRIPCQRPFFLLLVHCSLRNKRHTRAAERLSENKERTTRIIPWQGHTFSTFFLKEKKPRLIEAYASGARPSLEEQRRTNCDPSWHCARCLARAIRKKTPRLAIRKDEVSEFIETMMGR